MDLGTALTAIIAVSTFATAAGGLWKWILSNRPKQPTIEPHARAGPTAVTVSFWIANSNIGDIRVHEICVVWPLDVLVCKELHPARTAVFYKTCTEYSRIYVRGGDDLDLMVFPSDNAFGRRVKFRINYSYFHRGRILKRSQTFRTDIPIPSGSDVNR